MNSHPVGLIGSTSVDMIRGERELFPATASTGTGKACEHSDARGRKMVVIHVCVLDMFFRLQVSTVEAICNVESGKEVTNYGRRTVV